MKTAWTDERLQRLYRHYNNRFWEGRLPSCLVVATTEWRGCECEKGLRRIRMNVDSLRTDHLVRTVLLHEMVHIVADGHGEKWQREMERLQAAGARGIKSELRMYRSGNYETPQSIVQSFVDAAWEGATWEEAILDLDYKFGLVSSGGKPRNERAKRILGQAKKAFRRTERLCLQHRPLAGR